eukprot:215861_1
MEVEVSAQEIDILLDEIEQNEEKSQIKNTKHQVNWQKILTEIQNGNTTFVKNKITSKDIDINETDPTNGKTLLIYVTIIGNFELVKLVCNFGADVRITDNDGISALEYAQHYGLYNITELLFYRQLSGALGKDMKDIAMAIYDKNEEAKKLRGNNPGGDNSGPYSYLISDNIVLAMINAIRNRDPFSPDLLYYAWYFYVKKCKSRKRNALSTKELVDDGKDDKYKYYKDEYARQEAQEKRRRKNDNKLFQLWQVMMKTYEEILCDTSDKHGWDWLKKYFLNSLIWYLPLPNMNKKDDEEKETKVDEVDDADDMERILSQTLFMELLKRVRKESKKQSDLLLKEKIDKIKQNKPKEWEELIKYNITTDYSKNARQDKFIQAKYQEHQLSEDKYPSSTHFVAAKFYDTNIYLNNLLFRANVIDTMFQFDIKRITQEICLETGDAVTYRAGPVKTLTRSQTKVENDYINEEWPKSAKLLDCNRCALQFKTINSMMHFIEIFTRKINETKAGSIRAVIRCKNGWSVYSSNYPQYTDLKLNVLVESPMHGAIIVEIQFLLELMSSFKKKAHKLYGVERHFEMIYNFNKLQQKMKNFKDINGKYNMLIDLIKRNDISFFKTYWLTLVNDEDRSHGVKALIPCGKNFDANLWNAPFFHAILRSKNDIYTYLQTEYSDVLYNALDIYLNKYSAKGYKEFFYKMSTSMRWVLQFVETIYHFTNGDSYKLTKLFTKMDEKKNTIVSVIVSDVSQDSDNNCTKAIKYIINNPSINYDDKLKIFGANTATLTQALNHKLYDHLLTILSYFVRR